MQSNSDFEEILLAFNAASVKYLVIGAFALATYARPRSTNNDPKLVQPVIDAVARYGRIEKSFPAAELIYKA